MPLDARAGDLLDVVRDNRRHVAEQIVARLRDEVPAYRVMPEAELYRQLDIGISLVLDSLLDPGTEPQLLVAYADLARTRINEGMDVDTLIRAVRIGARTAIEFVQSHAADFDGAVMLSLAAALWDSVDHLVEHLRPIDMGDDLREAKEVAARRFVTACADASGIAELTEAAIACQLDLSAPHVIVRVPVADDTTLGLATRSLGPSTARQGFAIAYGDEAIAVVEQLPAAGTPFVAGASPAAQLAGCPAAYRVAGRVAFAAAYLGRTGLTTVDDLGLDLLVVEDTLVGQALAARYLDPLVSLGEFGTLLVESVAAYFVYEQRVHDAAMSLAIHPNTLRYRLAKFEDASGADLRRPRDLAEVWWALRVRGELPTAREPVSRRPRS